ncbi:hypothetical protein DPMN_049963 [Dreissena polymorpha]|uniref:Uncharacterized protein n=1 Tax=Dreissena polymorpha TaxID=45954 RepID=A0A9D4HNT6_DREPO|nr:hypothetical protein DPMN_049963 [Dreissena polymorpha]
MENSSVHIMTGKAVQVVLRDDFHVDTYLHNKHIIEMTQKDPEIQLLLNQTEELCSPITFTKGEETLADATCSEIFLRALYAT